MVEVVVPKGADNGQVFDPEEGLAPDGTIRTGARRDRVPAEFEPVLASAVAAFGEVSDKHSELHLYGSVATGTARLGASDVDLLAIGVPAGWARDVSADLSHRFIDVCRGVEIGQGEAADFRGGRERGVRGSSVPTSLLCADRWTERGPLCSAVSWRCSSRSWV